MLIGKDTTYWVYQVLRCNNEFRKRVPRDDPNCILTAEDDCYDYSKNQDGTFIDPECAPEEEISEWLSMTTEEKNKVIDLLPSRMEELF